MGVSVISSSGFGGGVVDAGGGICVGGVSGGAMAVEDEVLFRDERPG